MKRSIIAACLLTFFLISILSGCSSPSALLQKRMQYYSSAVDGELPDDLRLTIYYLSPSILTRVPLSSDQLISYSLTEKIIVESSELVKYQELLQKMNVSALQTNSEETYMNARLYYVFSTEDNEKLLEVVLSDRARDPFVNGIQVKDSNIVFELITPFLPEDVRNMFGF